MDTMSSYEYIYIDLWVHVRVSGVHKTLRKDWPLTSQAVLFPHSYMNNHVYKDMYMWLATACLCVGWLQFTPSQYYLLTIQFGNTALILAARGGHTLTVKALIGGEADPNIQGRVSGSHCSTAGLCSNVCYCNHSMPIS